MIILTIEKQNKIFTIHKKQTIALLGDGLLIKRDVLIVTRKHV